MFGYVKLCVPECRVKEYEAYKGVYCGLCRALGKCAGRCAKLTLSYDMTFFALLRMALEKTSPVFEKKKCGLHPFGKHSECMPNSALALCAAATVLLSDGKNKDDLADEKGLKKMRALFLKPYFAWICRRPAKKVPTLAGVISESLAALSEYEKKRLPSVDTPALLFGEGLGRVLSFGLEGETARIAHAIGKAVGKWVYLIDAADDFDKDKKKSAFNPLVLAAGGEVLNEQMRRELEDDLRLTAADALDAYDLLSVPDPETDALIRNILELGMPETAKRILGTGKKENRNAESL